MWITKMTPILLSKCQNQIKRRRNVTYNNSVIYLWHLTGGSRKIRRVLSLIWFFKHQITYFVICWCKKRNLLKSWNKLFITLFLRNLYFTYLLYSQKISFLQGFLTSSWELVAESPRTNFLSRLWALYNLAYFYVLICSWFALACGLSAWPWLICLVRADKSWGDIL